jgi:hypothetical protein
MDAKRLGRKPAVTGVAANSVGWSAILSTDSTHAGFRSGSQRHESGDARLLRHVAQREPGLATRGEDRFDAHHTFRWCNLE